VRADLLAQHEPHVVGARHHEERRSGEMNATVERIAGLCRLRFLGKPRVLRARRARASRPASGPAHRPPWASPRAHGRSRASTPSTALAGGYELLQAATRGASYASAGRWTISSSRPGARAVETARRSTTRLLVATCSASSPSKRSRALKRSAMGRLGTPPHNLQTKPNDRSRCKRRELPAYLGMNVQKVNDL
jgi:hypothetical protein